MKKMNMLRSLRLLAPLLFPLMAHAQEKTTALQFPEKDGNVVYEAIVEMPGSKAELYSRAKKTLIDLFPKEAIDAEDAAEGRLISKQYLVTPIKLGIVSHDVRTAYSVQLDCKDNKYRYRIYDLRILTVLAAGREEVDGVTKNRQALGSAKSTYKTKIHAAQISAIDQDINILITKLQKGMSTADDF